MLLPQRRRVRAEKRRETLKNLCDSPRNLSVSAVKILFEPFLQKILHIGITEKHLATDVFRLDKFKFCINGEKSDGNFRTFISRDA
jgi:hypothetical protein